MAALEHGASRQDDTAPALWIKVAALVFAVTFVAGFMLSGDTPDYDASDQEWMSWFDDDGNRTGAVLGGLLMAASGVAMVLLAAGVGDRLRGGSWRSGRLATVSVTAGTAFAVTALIGGVATNQVAAALEFAPDYPMPGADVMRQAEQLGVGVTLVGAWFVALWVATVCWALRGTPALPNWVATAGLVVAVLLLFSVFFLPLLLLPLWVIAFAFTLRSEVVDAAPEAAVTP